MKPFLLAAMIAAQSLDTTTTCMALHRGFVESNPLLPSSCSGIVAVKTGIVIPLATVMARQRLTRLQKLLLVGVAASGGYATVHNIRQLSKHTHGQDLSR